MQNRGNAGRAGGKLQRNTNAMQFMSVCFRRTMQSMKKDLDVLREICQNTAVPVIGSGHIFRMEDVKKLVICRLPAGDAGLCRSGAAGADKEVSLKFGKEKNRSRRCRYFASGTGKELLKEYTSNVFFVLSRCNGGGCADVSGSGGNLFCRRVSLEKLIEVLSCQYQRYFR